MPHGNFAVFRTRFPYRIPTTENSTHQRFISYLPRFPWEIELLTSSSRRRDRPTRLTPFRGAIRLFERYDARNVHLLPRDRRFGRLRYKRSRAEQKQILLIEQGYEFFKDTGCKHRFVGIFGDRRTKRILRVALRWEVLPYPKRAQSPEDRSQVVDLDPVPMTFAAASAT
jgi:hypothetical protein